MEAIDYQLEAHFRSLERWSQCQECGTHTQEDECPECRSNNLELADDFDDEPEEIHEPN